MRCLLASTSPRRKELFSYICASFDVVSPSYDEEEYDGSGITEFVLRQAKGKLESVRKEHYDVIVTADTVVYIPSSDVVLGKPKDREDALYMLRLLLGRTHSVITAVAVYVKGNIHLSYETTHVKFRVVPDEFLEEYILTGMPLDKAGAYGIQDKFGAVLVESIIGDYYNVVGFPVGRVWEILSPYISV